MGLRLLFLGRRNSNSAVFVLTVTRSRTMSRSAGRSSLTPESLVSVLLPHISKQTLLLPTLHTQLGLPPSALEADLSALREALLQTVENCVSNRQREIDAWEEKCENIERRCRRLENALGRRASSLGNAKKQTVSNIHHILNFLI
jgi:protein regulator of cytokinesis 1